jgi:hypothetical protein
MEGSDYFSRGQSPIATPKDDFCRCVRLLQAFL